VMLHGAGHTALTWALTAVSRREGVRSRVRKKESEKEGE
jgi:hypothetical protein